MKTLIVYRTIYGTTAKVSSIISQKIDGDEIVRHELSEKPWPSPHEFDRVIIGGSIRAGVIQPEIRQYCKRFIHILEKKQLGLFACGLNPGKNRQHIQLSLSYPARLRNSAQIVSFMGGELDLNKLKLWERVMVKQFAPQPGNIQNLDYDEIDRFCEQLQIV